MSFRNSLVSDVIILEGLTKEELASKIKEVSAKLVIIDLQYAVTYKGLFKPYKHHAILLVQKN